jgi:uncharacterized protein (TIGR03067 family)
MSRRALLLAAALAAASLMAFAPAPLPRRGGRSDKDSVSLTALIGTWRATSLKQTGQAQVQAGRGGIDSVQITATQWIFNPGRGPTTYDLRIDHTRKPAEVDMMYAGQKDPYGRGIIRREGNTLRIVYNWGTQRPTGFDNQPGGYWDLTLVRE